MRMIAALLGLWIACASAAEAPHEDKPQRVQLAGSPLQVQLVEDPAGEAHTKEREAKSDKHDAEDLAAQWLAARSAAQQVTVAWASLILSALATVGALGSLWLTRRSVEVARHAALSVDRPWLRFHVNANDQQVVGWVDGRLSVPLTVSIENVGKGPATGVQTYIKYRVLGALGHPWMSAEDFARTLNRPEHAFSKILFAGGNGAQTFNDSISDEDVKQGLGHEGTFIVQALVAVQYRIPGDDIRDIPPSPM